VYPEIVGAPVAIEVCELDFMAFGADAGCDDAAWDPVDFCLVQCI
jgi:hypothetical protein